MNQIGYLYWGLWNLHSRDPPQVFTILTTKRNTKLLVVRGDFIFILLSHGSLNNITILVLVVSNYDSRYTFGYFLSFYSLILMKSVYKKESKERNYLTNEIGYKKNSSQSSIIDD